ncbi:hypothetical protein E6C60_1208 [Paenibacillus algicola]|uniref:Uncharacterized protein n=1 Tax=Paenibacillus algicola TaxID=2565926 RepID=A0A4P8XHD3_9BACL|nr:hypothetical protein [Paenibacillus algicola]QCT01926.1 hypothetical protein E6C60_1208 [Paenibacillus algicola]
MESTRNLGFPVNHTYLYQYDFIPSREGDETLVTVTNGNPARLCVVDVRQSKLRGSYPLEGADGAMVLEAAGEDRVIAGSFPNGELYILHLEQDEIQRLTVHSAGLSFVYAVCIVGDDLYFGGYPGCILYRIHLSTGIVSKAAEIDSREMYLRSMLEVDGELFIGCGAHVRLYRYQPAEKSCIALELGEEIEGSPGFVTNLRIYRNSIAASIEALDMVILCDRSSNRLIRVFRNFSQFIVVNEKLFLFNAEGTYYYQEEEDQLTHMSGSFTAGWKVMRAARMDEEHKLTGITRHGELSILSLSTGAKEMLQLPLPTAPALIQTIQEAPTGCIYMSGYQCGGLSIYDPVTGRTAEHKGIEQIDGMVFTPDKAYFGAYPGACIYEWDYSDEKDPEAMPRLLFRVGEHQDRPFAMAAHAEYLFVGTIPDYGKSGGALTEYDTVGKKRVTYRHLIEAQSISALAISPEAPRYLYGGTTVWGGLGQTPVESDGKLFIWDTVKKKVEHSWVPLQGEDGIGCLAFDSEGGLWGVTRGTLFQIDPSSGILLRSKVLVEKVWQGHFWRGPFLRVLSDGDLIVNVDRTIYRLNKDSLEAAVIYRDAKLLAVDEARDTLYFVRNQSLFSIQLT